MNAELAGGDHCAAVRAVYKSYPAEEARELRLGHVAITTTRPGFWNDSPERLTWGDHLNALVVRIGAETEALRVERRELDDALDDADRALKAAKDEHAAALAAWDANGLTDDAVRVVEAQKRMAAAQGARDMATRAARHAYHKRVAGATSLLRFLENVAWEVADVDLEDHYGRCDH